MYGCCCFCLGTTTCSLSNAYISCIYNEVSDFVDGKAKVRLDVDYGYINTKGQILVQNEGQEVVIPKEYDWAYDFENGLAIVQQRGIGKWGCIDTQFNVVIPCRLLSKLEVERTIMSSSAFFGSSSKEEYLAKIKLMEPPIPYKENGLLYGIKSAEGRMLYPPVLPYIGKFKNGIAKVSLSVGRRVGFINEKLQWIIPPIYTLPMDFSDGLSLVDKYNYFNQQGERVITLRGHLGNAKSFLYGKAECDYIVTYPGKDDKEMTLSKRCVGFKLGAKCHEDFFEFDGMIVSRNDI